jgi:quercetin dioxygenase-like cupin family protein
MRSSFLKISGILVLTCNLLVSIEKASANETTLLKLPQDIIYKNTGLGIETSVLYGDPTKPGLYVVRLKLPAGSKVSPHIHPEEIRTMTVISGTLYFGFGSQWDESKLQAYPPGTFFTELPTTPHFISAKDGEVIFQATGIGPSGFIAAH